jgi:hypothetical protein
VQKLNKSNYMFREILYTACRPIIGGVVAAALVACAIPNAPTLEIRSPFDAQAAHALLVDGANTIKGNAFMRQQGGGVVTCAGQIVYLVPATAYAVERFQALYGSVDRGVNASRVNYKFIPDPSEYYNLSRSSRCDSQGNFLFENVANGDFFATTVVSWQAGNSLQGGHLMHRIAVKSGKTISLVMTP